MSEHYNNEYRSSASFDACQWAHLTDAELEHIMNSATESTMTTVSTDIYQTPEMNVVKEELDRAVFGWVSV